MNRRKRKEKKRPHHDSCFVIRDSAAPPRRGFALLFAILASSVLLSVAVAIWSIALREVVLSSFGRESLSAFYASDSGAECALYWDLKGAFATSTDSPPGAPIICAEQNITPIPGYRDTRNAVSSFSLGAPVCADVTVAKNDSDGDGFSLTTIESRGHNTCDTGNPTYVERGLRVTY